METLLVVAQHRHQYYGRSKAHGSDGFVSSPSSDFGEINCRTFASGVVEAAPPTPTAAAVTPPGTAAAPSSATSSTALVRPPWPRSPCHLVLDL